MCSDCPLPPLPIAAAAMEDWPHQVTSALGGEDAERGEGGRLNGLKTDNRTLGAAMHWAAEEAPWNAGNVT
jgi:hypothetical protein